MRGTARGIVARDGKCVARSTLNALAIDTTNVPNEQQLLPLLRKTFRTLKLPNINQLLPKAGAAYAQNTIGSFSVVLLLSPSVSLRSWSTAGGAGEDLTSV